jgi:hypothetical protein
LEREDVTAENAKIAEQKDTLDSARDNRKRVRVGHWHRPQPSFGRFAFVLAAGHQLRNQGRPVIITAVWSMPMPNPSIPNTNPGNAIKSKLASSARRCKPQTDPSQQQPPFEGRDSDE